MEESTEGKLDPVVLAIWMFIFAILVIGWGSIVILAYRLST